MPDIADPPNAATLLIGLSKPAQRLWELISKVGRSNVPVLLEGESGTGKEVAARSIFGIRALGNFVPVDCAALPASLVESELFGHERGAFTGAYGARIGLLQAADQGTAFFDEIGELPREAQAKLLRVLQQKEIRQIGSNYSRRCSFRSIAATNRDLADDVVKGIFRLDLYYRINVVTIRLPPLRERLEDIPVLVNHFLRKAGQHHEVTPAVIDALMRHNWPGNIRELENAVARLAALSTDDALHTEDLAVPLQGFTTPRDILPAGAPEPAQAPAISISPGAGADELTMNSLQRIAIERAMSDANGNATCAARILGIGRTTLYRKLKKYAEDRLVRK